LKAYFVTFKYPENTYFASAANSLF